MDVKCLISVTSPSQYVKECLSGLVSYYRSLQRLLTIITVLHADQSHLAETCPQSTWQWIKGLDGGSLIIKYKTKKKAGGHNYCTPTIITE